MGADIPEEKSPKSLEEGVRQIIEVCDVCFQETNESDVEIVLNDIMSILLVVSFQTCATFWYSQNLLKREDVHLSLLFLTDAGL